MAKRRAKDGVVAGEGPSADYAVGYGKPPKANQFKAGKSGNPKGRTKEKKGFHASLALELSSKITVVENGVRKSMTKGDAAAKRAVEKALKGDLPSIRFVAEVERSFALTVAIESAVQAEAAAQDLPSESEAEMLAFFAQAARAGRWGPDVGTPGPNDEEVQDHE